MNRTIKYIRGSAGFKSALTTKLGAKWMQTAQDIGQDVISFPLSEDSTLDNLRSLIGADILSEHDITFFDELPMSDSPYAHLKQIPQQAFKMSIWVNRDSNITGSSAKGEGEIKLA